MLRALAITAIAACGAPLPRPTDADVLRAGSRTTLAELERGRTLYRNHCGNCHRAYSPEILTPEKWPAQIDEMAGRAKLGTGARELIVLYVVTLAGRQP
jgi:hypothetical protein